MWPGLDEHIVFGKVGLTARYLNMISLDGVANEMQNSTVEFKLESCNNLANISVVESYWSAENSSWQPTWCHSTPMAKNWSEKRKEEYNKSLGTGIQMRQIFFMYFIHVQVIFSLFPFESRCQQGLEARV